MKKAFTTLGNPDWTLKHTLEEAKRMGFDGIDIRGIEGKMAADEIEYFQYGRLQETKRMIQQSGLKICCFGSSAKFHDESLWEKSLKDVYSAIDVCDILNIPYVRVFGNNLPVNESSKKQQQVLHTIAKGIQKACDYAKGTNVKVLLEIHGDINTSERVKEIISNVHSEHFGILWDVAHSDLVYRDDFKNFYQTIQPWLCHVHLKDHIQCENGQTKLVSIGTGDIPLVKIVTMLLEDGYDGYFALEWEKKWFPQLAEPEQEYPHFIEWANSNFK